MSSERPYSHADIVRAWTADGWDASQAVEWIDAGWHVTPDEWDLEAERDIASMAAEWRDAEYGPADALSWDLAVTSPLEATAWAQAGYSADEALAVVGHCQVEHNNLDSGQAPQPTSLTTGGRAAFPPRGWSCASAQASVWRKPSLCRSMIRPPISPWRHSPFYVLPRQCSPFPDGSG